MSKMESFLCNDRRNSVQELVTSKQLKGYSLLSYKSKDKDPYPTIGIFFDFGALPSKDES